MENYKQQVAEATDFLKTQLNKPPSIGLLTGTGLGQTTNSLQISQSFDYGDLPHFPVSTVESHQGRLLAGEMAEKSVIALQGRFHLYEGYAPLEVTFPIRVMQELGVKVLILSNAAGGLNPNYSSGDIMVIRDHINLTMSNPLIGPNVERWGIRFPDMTRAYDVDLAKLATHAADNTDIQLQTGVYAGLKGPCLETPAEIRFLRTIGADAVGFSTVQEVIAAVHAGMRVLGLSTITNVHNPDDPHPSTVEKIIAVAQAAAPRLELIMRKVLENIDETQRS
ncbi:MAG: purine-nucleoside phosphorylase [Desulfobacterales bacterium]